MKESAIGEIEP